VDDRCGARSALLIQIAVRTGFLLTIANHITVVSRTRPASSSSHTSRPISSYIGAKRPRHSSFRTFPTQCKRRPPATIWQVFSLRPFSSRTPCSHELTELHTVCRINRVVEHNFLLCLTKPDETSSNHGNTTRWCHLGNGFGSPRMEQHDSPQPNHEGILWLTWREENPGKGPT